MGHTDATENLNEVAIVGMAGRFPGARNLEEFWHNLRAGVESISFFTDEELAAAGAAVSSPNYVKARAVLDDPELFDADFFGFSNREAEILDPQHRLLLETAWHTLEDAGYDSGVYAGRVGVYAAVSMSTYKMNLFLNRALLDTVGGFHISIGNDRDFLATRISYKLNLSGPSINVQTACSSSLVAVHLACQSLLNGESDMALAGGAAVSFPTRSGYMFEEGGILSSDGHCRTFDGAADGTVPGHGVGMVLLKRLADALADGDQIHAVIKGTAVNNDGAHKVGYTAPSVKGQAEVIAEALGMAGVGAESINYVEAHGSGTPLGDPIEIAALTKVFRAETDRKAYCAVGSVKTNVGHLDVAAGVAGLIKSVLALKHRELPPSLNFDNPNPKIDFANSPFYVNTRRREWVAGPEPRRAGVNSFGLGGTNAHVILEEAPEPVGTGRARESELIVLSARTPAALEAQTAQLAAFLKKNPQSNLADVAHTLQVGRKRFDHRRVAVCREVGEAVEVLEGLDPETILTGEGAGEARRVAFMFPGVGDHYANMGLGLYRQEPAFREEVERCARILTPLIGFDITAALYPPDASPSAQPPVAAAPTLDLRRMLRREEPRADEAAERLNQTGVLHPAVFVVEYALARLWMGWGLKPEAMIGYSLGEYVAACLAGVFTLEDALKVVARRAQLIAELPAGGMLAVALPAARLRPMLDSRLSLAAVNGPELSVVSGPVEAVAELASELRRRGEISTRVPASHAFHSSMMEPLAGPLADVIRECRLRPPSLPFLSNLTGDWITAEEAVDPAYWSRHMCEAVNFADGLARLLEDESRVLLEVGPGQALTTLAIQQKLSRGEKEVTALPSMRHAYERRADTEFALRTLGQLWLSGVEIDWAGFRAGEEPRRVSLPGYPFERRRYWVEPQPAGAGINVSAVAPVTSGAGELIHVPGWKQSCFAARPGETQEKGRGACSIFFESDSPLSHALAQKLEAEGHELIRVRAGAAYAPDGPRRFGIDPRDPAHYTSLLEEIVRTGRSVERVLHCWTLTPERDEEPDARGFEGAQDEGFYSLLFLAQAMSRLNLTEPVSVWVVSSNAQSVQSGDRLRPEKAPLLALSRIIAHEYPQVDSQCLDVGDVKCGGRQLDALCSQLAREVGGRAGREPVAYRGTRRWVQVFEPLRREEAPSTSALREGGVYLITNWQSTTGYETARHLARTVRARLVLFADSRASAQAGGRRLDPAEARRRVEELELAGARVFTSEHELDDARAISEAVARAEESFGPLDGVVHACGLVESAPFSGIAETARADCERLFAEVAGPLDALSAALEGRSLDFCVVHSTLSPVLGGLGLAAHAAVCAFVDAFARRQNESGATRWVALNWDKLDTGDETLAPPGAGQSVLKADEIGELFDRAISAGPLVEQAALSAHDLRARIEQWVRNKATLTAETRAAASQLSLHSRPNLHTAYAAPETEAEQKLASLWQEILGVEQVGVHDNFFSLGGNSLMGIRLVARLRQTFGVNIPLRELFETQTVLQMALLIEDTLMDEIERLSDDEADMLYHEDGGA